MFSLLIVDDEISVINGLANDIDWHKIGIDKVHTADTGKRAIEIIQSGQIDIVISDICMPDMDGMEMTRILYNQWPLIKVIFLSGYEEFNYAKEAIDLKVFRYLTKPIRYDDLLEHVKAALNEIKRELKGNQGHKSFYNSFSVTFPPLSMLIESLQNNTLHELINTLFDECEASDSKKWEKAKKIHRYVSTEIVDLSLRKGFAIDSWAHGLEDRFYPSGHFQTLSDMRKWCLAVTTACIEHIAEEKHDLNHIITARAKAIVQANLNTDLQLPEIAAALYIHPNHLSRIFKELEGMTITDYSIALRINNAKELLRIQNNKIYEVAAKIGYESVGHFTRIFKREVGMTPKEYQKKAHRLD